MVPGTGLYLDELFFDKYNLKVGYEQQKTLELKEKQKLKQMEGSNAKSEDGGREDNVSKNVSNFEVDEKGDASLDENVLAGTSEVEKDERSSREEGVEDAGGVCMYVCAYEPANYKYPN